jgi:hypothetical protein
LLKKFLKNKKIQKNERARFAEKCVAARLNRVTTQVGHCTTQKASVMA